MLTGKEFVQKQRSCQRLFWRKKRLIKIAPLFIYLLFNLEKGEILLSPQLTHKGRLLARKDKLPLVKLFWH